MEMRFWGGLTWLQRRGRQHDEDFQEQNPSHAAGSNVPSSLVHIPVSFFLQRLWLGALAATAALRLQAFLEGYCPELAKQAIPQRALVDRGPLNWYGSHVVLLTSWVSSRLGGLTRCRSHPNR